MAWIGLLVVGCEGAPLLDAGADAGSDAGTSASSLRYCNCLLIECHDVFHDTFGETDEEALAACELAADALPRAGMPVDEGNTIECRRSHCEGADEDPVACAAALGAAPCE
jgi:hypothetical protein